MNLLSQDPKIQSPRGQGIIHFFSGFPYIKYQDVKGHKTRGRLPSSPVHKLWYKEQQWTPTNSNRQFNHLCFYHPEKETSNTLPFVERLKNPSRQQFSRPSYFPISFKCQTDAHSYAYWTPKTPHSKAFYLAIMHRHSHPVFLKRVCPSCSSSNMLPGTFSSP